MVWTPRGAVTGQRDPRLSSLCPAPSLLQGRPILKLPACFCPHGSHGRGTGASPAGSTWEPFLVLVPQVLGAELEGVATGQLRALPLPETGI